MFGGDVEMGYALSREDMSALEDRGEMHTFESGEIILQEGLATSSIYVIKAGEVEISQGDRNAPLVLAKCQAGDIIGEVGFLVGCPATATVVAKKQTTVLELSKVRLSVFLDMDDQFSKRFYRFLSYALAGRLRNLAGMASDLVIT